MGGHGDIVAFQPRQSYHTAAHTPTQDVRWAKRFPLEITQECFCRSGCTPRALSGDPNSRSHRSLGTWSSRWRRCSLQPAWPPRRARRWVNNLLLGTGRKAWVQGMLDAVDLQNVPLRARAGVGRGQPHLTPMPGHLALRPHHLLPACPCPTVTPSGPS